MSRNTVRLALQQLEDSGALVSQAGRRTFLTAEQSPTLAAIVKRMEAASPADVMEGASFAYGPTAKKSSVSRPPCSDLALCSMSEAMGG